MNKYGTYIQKLMTVVLDKEQDEFVQQMAWNELNRLKDGVREFLMKHSKDDSKNIILEPNASTIGINTLPLERARQKPNKKNTSSSVKEGYQKGDLYN